MAIGRNGAGLLEDRADRNGLDARGFDREAEVEIVHQALDGPTLLFGDQADDGPGGAGAGSAAGPVQVVLVVSGRVEVNHRSDRIDVDASGGDIGGDQRLSITTGEGLEGPLPLVLGTAAVHGDGTHPQLGELARQAVGAVTGTGEDDGPAGSRDHIGGALDALLVPDQPEVVGGVDGLWFDGPGLVTHRVVLEVPAEDGDIAVERRREQQRLTSLGGPVEDAADGGHESHIGHPVGLVHHHDVGIAQVDGSLVDEVFEAAGVATRMSTPLRRALICGPYPTPP